MEVLKIVTAGSVDDGKSTLIGRLLYDTKSLTTDKLEAIENKSKQLGYDYLDFSLATDGLVAERDQGITIDVAHIYFSTLKKSYIIADTPGHVEYTRNMVTGASTSEASIILIDARKGVIEQTYRHFFINNLLGVKTIFVAINKMDLVDYSKATYEAIRAEFKALMSKRDFEGQEIIFVPISALKGDNVVSVSDKMSWYSGKPLLSYLEDLKPQNKSDFDTARFPVQSVIRPKTEDFHDFRGYAGKVNSGDLAVGDDVIVLPSLQQSKIKTIHFYDKKVDVAVNKSSVLITLEDDLNISRGDMIVKKDNLPKTEKEFTATVSWMDSQPLNTQNKYILQHGVNKVITKIKNVNFKINTDYSGVESNVETLATNDIASVDFKTNKPIFYDAYKINKQNGAFILIDYKTNNTVGVGFIQ